MPSNPSLESVALARLPCRGKERKIIEMGIYFHQKKFSSIKGGGILVSTFLEFKAPSCDHSRRTTSLWASIWFEFNS